MRHGGAMRPRGGCGSAGPASDARLRARVTGGPGCPRGPRSTGSRSSRTCVDADGSVSSRSSRRRRRGVGRRTVPARARAGPSRRATCEEAGPGWSARDPAAWRGRAGRRRAATTEPPALPDPLVRVTGAVLPRDRRDRAAAAGGRRARRAPAGRRHRRGDDHRRGPRRRRGARSGPGDRAVPGRRRPDRAARRVGGAGAPGRAGGHQRAERDAPVRLAVVPGAGADLTGNVSGRR